MKIMLLIMGIAWSVQSFAGPAGPEIGPAGGTFKGPVMVTVQQPPKDAVLRVTVDGSDPSFAPYLLDGSRPMTRSYDIRAPFRLACNAAVKARFFDKQGNPVSPVSAAAFIVQPRLAPGVPFYPVRWDEDVETWWAGHPMNPRSKNAWKGEIVSPPFRVNVAEVWAKNPTSETAGIEESLALLPPDGGTLWFPKDKGPYVVTKADNKVRLSSGYEWGGAIKIRSRNNLHFLSDGATIRGDHTLFGFAGEEFGKGGQIEHPAVNFYFKGLVFDGNDKAGTATLFPQEGLFFHFLNTCDVLFDDCRFVRAVAPKSGHQGLISLSFKSDNVWCRSCHFDSGMWGVYWDGVHGGGLVNCTFGDGLSKGGFLLFTNDDLSPFDFRLRSAQYVVAAGCTFGSPAAQGQGSASAFAMAGERCLFVDNDVYRPYGTAMASNGKLAPDYREYRYDYRGNRIVSNRLHDVETLLAIRSVPQAKTLFPKLGGCVVRGNQATGLDRILFLNRTDDAPPIADVLVTDNDLAGRQMPQVVVTSAQGQRDVKIAGNRLGGEPRAPISGPGAESLPAGAITWTNNTVSGAPQEKK